MKDGFTLTEILISLTILSSITLIGTSITLSFSKHYSFQEEKHFILGLLQKARSQSMSNIQGTRHGIRFVSNSNKYILFQCPKYTPECFEYPGNQSTDQIFEAQTLVKTLINDQVEFDIVFDQLSGCISYLEKPCESESIEIQLYQNNKLVIITIHKDGKIEW
jgi:prepilin-type N-terminal cleavage/methylation domain-containing protein